MADGLVYSALTLVKLLNHNRDALKCIFMHTMKKYEHANSEEKIVKNLGTQKFLKSN